MTPTHLEQEIFRLRHRLNQTMAHLQQKERHRSNLHLVYEVVKDQEKLSSCLYHLRRIHPPSDPLVMSTEDYLANLMSSLLVFQTTAEGKNEKTLRQEAKEVVAQNLSLLLYVTLIFIATLLSGWALAVFSPENASALISPQTIQRIVENKPWFDQINDSVFSTGFAIASNNLQVTLMCFVSGIFLGIGGLLLLIYNGLHIGAVLGYCYVHGMDAALLEFIIGHGPLELTLLIVAAFSSAVYGRHFLFGFSKSTSFAVSQAARKASALFLWLLPWVLVAAFVEVFISPRPDITIQTKLLIGGVVATIFWLTTLTPLPQKKAEERKTS